MLGLCQTEGVSQKKETPDNLEFLHNCPFPLVPIPQLNLQFVPHAGPNREEKVLSCTNYEYIMHALGHKSSNHFWG